MTPADLTPDLFGPPPAGRSQQCIAAARGYAQWLPRARGGAKPLVYRQMIDALKAATKGGR